MFATCRSPGTGHHRMEEEVVVRRRMGGLSESQCDLSYTKDVQIILFDMHLRTGKVDTKLSPADELLCICQTCVCSNVQVDQVDHISMLTTL